MNATQRIQNRLTELGMSDFYVEASEEFCGARNLVAVHFGDASTFSDSIYLVEPDQFLDAVEGWIGIDEIEKMDAAYYHDEIENLRDAIFDVLRRQDLS